MTAAAEDETKKRTVLDQSTLVPLGMVVSGGLALFGMHSWLTSQFDKLDRRLEKIEERTWDRWYRTDQKLWASELARQNPSIVVPLISGDGPPR